MGGEEAFNRNILIEFRPVDANPATD